VKLPAVWIAAAFSFGIALARVVAGGTAAWIGFAAAAILVGLLLFWKQQTRAAWILALLAWCGLGGLASRLEQAATPSNNVARLLAEGKIDASEPLRWRGQLRSDPMQLPWGWRYEIDLDEVEAAGQTVSVSGGLRLSYFRNPKNAEEPALIRAGDRVEALARARRPRNFLDPGAFDERGFLRRQNIDLTATLRSTELLRPLSATHLSPAHRLARIRGALLGRVDALFAAQPERAAVLRAMLLGDRNFVDSELAVKFQKTAAYHVLVLAGLHVAALTIFLLWLGRRLRISLAVTTIATLLLLAAYVGVVQDRPPILRAALMAAVFLSSRLLFRRVELLNTVGVAALVLLFAKPSALGDASFQLSFLAAAVIAGLALPWIDRSSGPYRKGLEHLGDVTRDAAHSAKVIQLRLDLRAATRWLSARMPRRMAPRAAGFVGVPLRAGFGMWELVVLSATIQLCMLPLLALYFHRVSLTGPASNIPAVLLTGLIVPLGFLTLLLSFAWLRLAAAFSKVLGAMVGALVSSVEWFSGWQHGSYRIPGPPGWLVAAFLGTLVLLVMLARAARRGPNIATRRAEWIAAAMLAALAVAVGAFPFPPDLERGRLEVTVLDVGQGDSIFTAFPDGRTMLIDGGGLAGGSRAEGYRTGTDVGEEVVSPYLWQRRLKRVDVVALTHAHHDHLDGLRAVLENFRVGQLWVGRDVGTAAYRSLLAEAQARGIVVVHRVRDDAFNWDGVQGRFLWPKDSSETPEAKNDDSLVLQLADGEIRFLLPGDVQSKQEKELVATGAPLAADFLKVPHHGSKTSSTAEFIAAVAPQVVVISVGEANSFGHPNAGVITRYEARGVHLLRTDHDGAVTAWTDGHSLSVHTFVERNAP
jgi:competence protein ComEC